MGTARNAPCACGSGKKYKHCCLRTGGAAKNRRRMIGQVGSVVIVAAAVVCFFVFGREVGLTVGVGGLLGLAAYLFVFTDPPPPTSGGNPGAINFGR